MYKHILESIPGIEIYPIFSLILFFILFAGIVFWAFFRADKKYIKRMEELPLDSSSSSITNGE